MNNFNKLFVLCVISFSSSGFAISSHHHSMSRSDVEDSLSYTATPLGYYVVEYHIHRTMVHSPLTSPGTQTGAGTCLGANCPDRHNGSLPTTPYIIGQ